jgi:hypothetical protein
MLPTTARSASTSKSSVVHSPIGARHRSATADAFEGFIYFDSTFSWVHLHGVIVSSG